VQPELANSGASGMSTPLDRVQLCDYHAKVQTQIKTSKHPVLDRLSSWTRALSSNLDLPCPEFGLPLAVILAWSGKMFWIGRIHIF